MRAHHNKKVRGVIENKIREEEVVEEGVINYPKILLHVTLLLWLN